MDSLFLAMLLTCVVAAALALLDVEGIEAEEIVRRAMKIAGDMCVYTNHNLTLERLEPKPAEEPKALPAPEPATPAHEVPTA